MKKGDIMFLKQMKSDIRLMMNELGYSKPDGYISSPCDRFLSRENKYSFEFWYPLDVSDHTIKLKMTIVGHHGCVLTYTTNLFTGTPLSVIMSRIKNFEDMMDRCIELMGMP